MNLLRPNRPRGSDRLRDEPIVWLGSVDAAGRPHLVPTWFNWDGEAIWIFSKPHAVKVRNARHDPRVTLALGEPEEDFDVQLIEANVELLDEPSAAVVQERHWSKYGRQLRKLGISRQEYVETYSQPMRIRPTRFLPWHGRGPRWARPRRRMQPLPQPQPLPALRLSLRLALR
jgi:PPOX class probable F420-dependent enzyme